METKIARLQGLLFVDPERDLAWPPFLEALAEEVAPGVHAIALIETTTPAPSTIVATARSRHVVPGWLPRRGDGGPRIEALGIGQVFDLPRLPAALASHPVVRGVIEPLGLEPGPGLGVVLSREGKTANGILVLLSEQRSWSPTKADRALLERLAPAIAHASWIRQRLNSIQAVNSILDHLVLGVVVLDDHGRVAYVNRSAAEMTGFEPGLREPGQPDASDPRSDALIRDLRRDAASRASVLTHPGDGRQLRVLATRLAWPDPMGVTARRFETALVISDPKVGSTDVPGSLEDLYGLTPGEAKLAWLLAGDVSLTEAARRLGIAESTARTVLKRVLGKTGTRRQASLVRLVLSGPGQLRADAKATAGPSKRRRPSR